MTPMALVVDDEPDVRELVAIVLVAAGFGVRTASTGFEALDEIASGGRVPDLVVLDVNMPDMDGWQILSAIRADERARDIPVIMCTVYVQPSDIHRAWTLGCDGYIAKPFAIAELTREALAVIDRPSPVREDVRREKLAPPSSDT